MKKLEVKVYRWEQFIPYIEENKDDLISMGIDANLILQYDYKTRKMLDGSETGFPTNLMHTFVKTLVNTEARQHGRIFPETQEEVAKHFMLENYEKVRIELEEAYNASKKKPQKSSGIRSLKTKLEEAYNASKKKPQKSSGIRSLKTKLGKALRDEDRKQAHELVDEILDFTEEEIPEPEGNEEVEEELVEDSDEAPEPEVEVVDEEIVEEIEETETQEEVLEEMAEAIQINVVAEEIEKANEIKNKNMKVCVVCGETYKSRSPKQKFCSKKCRNNRQK